VTKTAGASTSTSIQLLKMIRYLNNLNSHDSLAGTSRRAEGIRHPLFSHLTSRVTTMRRWSAESKVPSSRRGRLTHSYSTLHRLIRTRYLSSSRNSTSLTRWH
jgi:hypothetical protein